MKTMPVRHIAAGLVCLLLQTGTHAQDSPKKLLDMLPSIPKQYTETFDKARCEKFALFKEQLEASFKSVTPALQQLQPKVPMAMMSDPMILANENILAISQYHGHEYFSEATETGAAVKGDVEGKKSALMESLAALKERLDRKYDCGKHPVASAQERSCLKAYREELFSEQVKAYNAYLLSVQPLLEQYHQKLKRFIMHIDANMIAVPDRKNEAVRFYMYDANQSSNLMLSQYAGLLDIHCPQPEFISKPEE